MLLFDMPSQGWNCYGVSRHSTEVEWGFPRGLVRPAAHPSSAPAQVAGTTWTPPSLEPSGRSRSARGPTTVCDGGQRCSCLQGGGYHRFGRGWRRTASPSAAKAPATVPGPDPAPKRVAQPRRAKLVLFATLYSRSPCSPPPELTSEVEPHEYLNRQIRLCRADTHVP